MSMDWLKAVGRTKPYKEHLRESLKTTDDYVGYLDACYKEGPETFALAVQDVLEFSATSMRSACVEKVKALGAKKMAHYDLDHERYSHLLDQAIALDEAAGELESVTTQEEEAKQS